MKVRVAIYGARIKAEYTSQGSRPQVEAEVIVFRVRQVITKQTRTSVLWEVLIQSNDTILDLGSFDKQHGGHPFFVIIVIVCVISSESNP